MEINELQKIVITDDDIKEVECVLSLIESKVK